MLISKVCSGSYIIQFYVPIVHVNEFNTLTKMNMLSAS